MTPPYRPRAIRRTAQTMQTIRDALFAVVKEGRPMTVRQVFYQMVSRGVIEKSEAQYHQTVGRLLTQLRVEGLLPFEWIADTTRWMRKPRTWGSWQECLADTAALYRKRLWDAQKTRVEVWLEKDALAGVLVGVTAKYDVPLMVTRGYPSVSFLYAAAEEIGEAGVPTFIYYLGDFDPSGVDIARNVQARLEEWAPDADLTFERVAVTQEQIRRWNLPTRPTKAKDSRARSFSGRESVEVDAIPPETLRALVEGCITRHLNRHALKVTLAAEAEERTMLEAFAASGGPG